MKLWPKFTDFWDEDRTVKLKICPFDLNLSFWFKACHLSSNLSSWLRTCHIKPELVLLTMLLSSWLWYWPLDSDIVLWTLTLSSWLRILSTWHVTFPLDSEIVLILYELSSFFTNCPHALRIVLLELNLVSLISRLYLFMKIFLFISNILNLLFIYQK